MKAPATVSIRRARVADVDAIHAIELASFSDPWSRVGFRDAILGDRGLIIVAVGASQAVVGFAVMLVTAPDAEVANLAVAKEELRRGVGSALLDHLLASAEAEGVEAVHLEVRESNAAALALYASRGFREVARRRQYYRKPDEDAVVMQRQARAGGREPRDDAPWPPAPGARPQ
jgi:ribosomal-protein-alanine N-acetyltransferase